MDCGIVSELGVAGSRGEYWSSSASTVVVVCHCTLCCGQDRHHRLTATIGHSNAQTSRVSPRD
eukprot:30134-Eustigmatos_ZCMA.PRE.1